MNFQDVILKEVQERLKKGVPHQTLLTEVARATSNAATLIYALYPRLKTGDHIQVEGMGDAVFHVKKVYGVAMTHSSEEEGEDGEIDFDKLKTYLVTKMDLTLVTPPTNPTHEGLISEQAIEWELCAHQFKKVELPATGGDVWH